MQTTNHPIPQTIAHGLASLGRYGDTYMVHAAEGETVIPAEILLANPQLKADLFRQMQMMGIKNPNRYVVGSALNSLNPVTGQPEFFFKKIGNFFKKTVLPILGAAIGRSILGPLGAPAFAAGTAALVGEDPAAYGIGTLVSQVLGEGARGAADAEKGGRIEGFGSGIAKGITDPFRALGSLFTAGPQNVIAQGALGSLFMPESAQQFSQLYPDQGVYSPYRTRSDIQAQREAALQSGDMFIPPAIDRERGIYKVSADAGGMSPERQQLMEVQRQLMLGSRNAGSGLVETPFGTLSEKQFTEAKEFLANRISNLDLSAVQGIPGIGSSEEGMSMERYEDLLARGLLNPGDQIELEGGILRTVGEEPQTFMESLKSPSTLGNLAAFTLPAGLAYFAAKGDKDKGELTAEEIAAQQRAVDPQQVAFRESGTADPEQRDRLLAEAGIRPAFAYQGEEGIRRLARSMGISEDAARSYIGGYGSQYLAGGGEITGAGTGTSDSIPARLSDGEFVMTADAVRGAGNGSRDLGAARMYDLMSQFEGIR
jgi:hypothetical protein